MTTKQQLTDMGSMLPGMLEGHHLLSTPVRGVWMHVQQSSPDFLFLPFSIVYDPMAVEQLDSITAFITDCDRVSKEELLLIWI